MGAPTTEEPEVAGVWRQKVAPWIPLGSVQGLTCPKALVAPKCYPLRVQSTHPTLTLMLGVRCPWWPPIESVNQTVVPTWEQFPNCLLSYNVSTGLVGRRHTFAVWANLAVTSSSTIVVQIWLHLTPTLIARKVQWWDGNCPPLIINGTCPSKPLPTTCTSTQTHSFVLQKTQTHTLSINCTCSSVYNNTA